MLQLKPVRSTRQSKGWVLIESLISLLIFALIMSILNTQNRQDFDILNRVKAQQDKVFEAKQILRIRRIKQDFTWLEGEFETLEKSECETCRGELLGYWLLSWLSARDKVLIDSSEDLLDLEQ